MEVAVDTAFYESSDNKIVHLKIVKDNKTVYETIRYESCFEIDMSDDLDDVAFLSCD